MCNSLVFVTNTRGFGLGGDVHPLDGNRANDRRVDVRVVEALQSIERIGIDDHRPEGRKTLHVHALTVPKGFLAKAKGLQGRQGLKRQAHALSTIVRKCVRKEGNGLQPGAIYP